MKKISAILIAISMSAMLSAASLTLSCNMEEAWLGAILGFKFQISDATNAQVVDLMVMEPDVDSYRHLGATDKYTPRRTGIYHFEAVMTCDEDAEVHSNIVRIEVGNYGWTDDEHALIRLKGNKNVWKGPYLKNGDNYFMMDDVGEEGENAFWEAYFYVGKGDIDFTFSIIQENYEGDYYSGVIETLPYTLKSAGTYCFTASNLNGKTNINRDNMYVYTTTETNYDISNGDEMGRQAGKLFPILCDDNDHHIYYSKLEGASGNELRDAIMSITNEQKRVTSYQNLREAYAITDYREYGTIWDMYSLKTGTYLYPEGESGGESETNAAFNREHSLVKSYWGHENENCIPAFSDIVHVVPTNGYVNTCRLTYPYGEVGQVTQTFGNGSKKGYSNFDSYSDVVFEPIDEYKGDFARIYFYMLTCYADLDYTHNDHGKVTFYFDGERSQFTNYGQKLMLKWSRQDPVSKKETDRNDGIQAVQGNRNPFVDLPNLAEYLWGKYVGVPYSFDDHYVPTSLQQTENNGNIRAWMHDGNIFIDCSAPKATVEIINIAGQTVYSSKIAGPQMFNIPAGQGMHIVKATLNDGRIIVTKVM